MPMIDPEILDFPVGPNDLRFPRGTRIPQGGTASDSYNTRSGAFEPPSNLISCAALTAFAVPQRLITV
jgi:hypothetical protein